MNFFTKRLLLFLFFNLAFRGIYGMVTLADIYGFWVLPIGMFAIGAALIVFFESI